MFIMLRNISKDWSLDNSNDFSVDYDAIAVSDILDIHKYLMKKNDIV